MENNAMVAFCQIAFVFSVLLLMIGWSLVVIFDKDRAWRIVEPMLRHVRAQRTPEWERSSTINGIITLIFGLIILTFLLFVLF
jgi:hypothetical protein